MTRLVVVSAGLADPSSTRLLADRLAAATAEALAEVEVTHVVLRELAHQLTDRLLTGFPGPELAAAIAAVRDADGLVVVTPVFSASYSGLFKTFFDVLEPGTLDGKPVLVAATAGTARHSLVLEHALRPLFAYLRAVVVPTGVFAATEDFASPELEQRITRAAGELAALVGKVSPADAAGPVRRTVDDELAEPTPFEELLRRASAG
ncbi:NADPH-dependent FMN reductase [Nocardioides sp. zg-579]|uniref:NADPH-dependent FMN reductase n=1 Tax=Nocardioides marmotae TaxID=2663857 RepID=A0A6I3IZM2_9ACTN|nr:CE1759 family FMN reductase [Nocardioides marmotae]MCR6030941.1 NADPH-dependent FMN reductase [Gordonia jinghuaiqii]MTB94577.1 NADPH-dependent FMN reductase [Nocardioides marmotae]QKE01411.1 NADPH-dependent FMN reductase [Nocardioides marmotae]